MTARESVAPLPSSAELLAQVTPPQNEAEAHIVALMRAVTRDLAAYDATIAALDGQYSDVARIRRESAQRDRWRCYDRLASYAHAVALYREYGAQQATEQGAPLSTLIGPADEVHRLRDALAGIASRCGPLAQRLARTALEGTPQ